MTDFKNVLDEIILGCKRLGSERVARKANLSAATAFHIVSGRHKNPSIRIAMALYQAIEDLDKELGHGEENE